MPWKVEPFLEVTTPKYPFYYYSTSDEPSEDEQSPFACLEVDHLLFVQYLSLLDIVSTAQASYHFNLFAESFIFPSCKTLDLSDPLDFPSLPGGPIFLCEFRLLLNTLGPYVETLVLTTNRSGDPAADNVQLLMSSLMACNKLSELHVANIDYTALPLRDFDWSKIKTLHLLGCIAKSICHLPHLPHLEELALLGGCLEDGLGSSCKLHTLILDRTIVIEKILTNTLASNQSTLRSVTLAHLKPLNGSQYPSHPKPSNPIQYPSHALYGKCFSFVTNVTSLTVCHRMLKYVKPGNYKQLEIDAPLNDEFFEFLPNFPMLERLTVNDIQLVDDALPNYLQRLLRIETMGELHIVVDKFKVRQEMKAYVSQLTPADVNGRHLHVYVYSRREIRSRRWMSRGYHARCLLRTTKTKLCNERHLVDRLQSTFVCANLADPLVLMDLHMKITSD